VDNKTRHKTHLVAWIITSDLRGLRGGGLVIGRTISFDSPTNVVSNVFWLISKIMIEELGNRFKNPACELGLSAVNSFISLHAIVSNAINVIRQRICTVTTSGSLATNTKFTFGNERSKTSWTVARNTGDSEVKSRKGSRDM
jgi:hypothetical protein